MKIEIKRIRTTRYGTDGRLYINGNYVCDTTENPIHHLPTGTYQVFLQNHPVWKRKMPIITPVDGNLSSPFNGDKKGSIAHGNGLYNIYDCRIHVGKICVSGLVINSYDTFKTLYDRINNSLRRGHEIQVTISGKSTL